MQIQVTGRHLEITDEMRAYIEKKAARLPRFYDRIFELDAIFDHESEQYTLEVIVRGDRKHTFVGKETGPDALALVDLVVDKLERQLRKHKERNREHKHDGKPDLGAET